MTNSDGRTDGYSRHVHTIVNKQITIHPWCNRTFRHSSSSNKTQQRYPKLSPLVRHVDFLGQKKRKSHWLFVEVGKRRNSSRKRGFVVLLLGCLSTTSHFFPSSSSSSPPCNNLVQQVTLLEEEEGQTHKKHKLCGCCFFGLQYCRAGLHFWMI